VIEEKLKQIIDDSHQIFMRFGIKSMTMDDIARQLKISKKTLYKYVKDKNDLVKLVIENYCDLDRSNCKKIILKSENAIDEIIEISKHVSNMISEIHPSIHYDLAKYHNDAFQIINQHKNEYVYTCILDNLERGKKEQIYRENINSSIVARIYTEKIDLVFNGDIFPPKKFKFRDVHIEMMRYHIRGIASSKGLKYLQDRIKQEQINL